MRTSCVAVISGQLGSITSLATETTGGEILVAFLDQKWPQKRSQSAIFLGEHAARPPLACSHAHAMAVPI